METKYLIYYLNPGSHTTYIDSFLGENLSLVAKQDCNHFDIDVLKQ